MNLNPTLDRPLSLPAQLSSIAQWRQWPLQGRQWLASVGVPVWPGAIAAVVFVGLLLGFQQVVSGAVLQGAARNVAAAAHAEATWRCKALRDPGASQACLARLGAAHDAVDGDEAARARSPFNGLYAIR